MFKLITRIPLPSHSFPRLIRYSHLLLLSLSLLAGTLAAQTEQETKQAEAERLLNEAVQLFQVGSKIALEQALQKLQQARPLFHSLNDASTEAITLLFIGKVYNDLGERQKALDFYDQALPLFRVVSDKDGEATTLNNIGLTYDALGEKQKALDYFNQALPLHRASGDKRGEAIVLSNIGSVYDTLGEKQEALSHFNQALPLFRAIGDRGGEAVTLNNVGGVYNDLGEKQKALDHFNQAFLLHRTLGDRKGEAATLNNIGSTYDDLGEKQKALDFYNQALPLFHVGGDRGGEAATLNNIGRVYDTLGEKQKALDYFNQALPLFHVIGDRRGEALALNNIGLAYDAIGEKQKALDYFNQALPLHHSVGNKEGVATTLGNIGSTYDALGEKQKALDFYNQALLLHRASGDRSGEAVTLNNIGHIYDDLGEKQKALDFYNRVLLFIRTLGDKRGEAAALNNIGNTYDTLGEKQKALDYFNQALPLFRIVGDKNGEAATLNNMGLAYNALGEKQKALDYFNQALPLRRASGDKGGEATTLGNIGLVYDDLGKKRAALDFYNQALLLHRAVGARGGEATTLNNTGRVYDDLGEKQKALAYYNQALLLHRAVGDRSGEALTLTNIAAIERGWGNLPEARTNVKDAIDIIESLRGEIFNQDLRSSYFSTVQDYYEFYIDVLMRLHAKHPKEGYDGEALQVSERARARVLLETLAEANADIRQGVDPRLVERERSLQRQLNASALWQTQLLNGPHSREQAVAVTKEIESLTTEFQQVEAQIRQTSPRYASLTQPQPLDSKAIRAQLDPDTLLLEYSLGTEHSYLWLVSPTDVQTFELPARKQIEAVAGAFIENLMTGTQIYVGVNQNPPVATGIADAQQMEMQDNALRLSQMLLGPAASHLGQKRLVIVGDGILLKLPFAALPDVALYKQGTVNAQPLILRHEVVCLPSVSALVSLRNGAGQRKAPPKELVVLADPVFYPDDVRVKRNPWNKPDQPPALATDPVNVTEKVEMSALETGALRDGKRLERLAGTRKEADGIIRFVPVGGAEEALDFAANRELVNSGELSRYRYVHFATHALLNNTHPELTAIVLSLVDENGNPRDGFLRAHEIYNLNLTSDVVVLSACETGLGKEVKGEGLIGLTRGFMYAGSPRVVVSLWSVRDDSTAQLMVSFYRGMIKEGKRPAEALRAAQIEMLKGERWQAPRYWAAFALQGEWR